MNLQNRDDWIRTSGPFVPNEVRYQAALHPGMISPLLAHHIINSWKCIVKLARKWAWGTCTERSRSIGHGALGIGGHGKEKFSGLVVGFSRD